MRDALIALLRKLAGYVQEHCGNNLANLLSSGFEAVSVRSLYYSWHGTI